MKESGRSKISCHSTLCFNTLDDSDYTLTAVSAMVRQASSRNMEAVNDGLHIVFSLQEVPTAEEGTG